MDSLLFEGGGSSKGAVWLMNMSVLNRGPTSSPQSSIKHRVRSHLMDDSSVTRPMNLDEAKSMFKDFR